MTNETLPDTDPFATEPAEDDATPEPAAPVATEDDTPAPVTTSVPTVVNPQAHEPIQDGERAQVGQTVDTSATPQ